MKDIIKTLKEAAKENPKELIECTLAFIMLFALLWGGLWFIAIIEGRA
jgi:hypothetical protein